MSESSEPPNPSPAPIEAPLGGRMLSGAAWMVGMRLAMRGLGLISVSILARVLTPDDFGIVAMAMVVMSLLTSFQDFGLDMALIRERDIEDSHYHTAWTFSVLLGAATSLVMLPFGPLAADYFGDQRVELIIWVLALTPLLNGLANIKTVDFRRDLHFHRDFAYNLIVKGISAATGIALALWLRTYWALVWGIVASTAVQLVVGYAMAPFWPRLSLAKWRGLLSFSVWVSMRTIAGVAGGKVDQILIGRMFGAHDMGGYNVSQQVTGMITNELVAPAGRSLLPGYVRIRDEPARLRRAYESVLSFHVIAALPLGIGLALVAPHAVSLLLGAQWLPFVAVFQILALAATLPTVYGAAGPLMIATGHVRSITLITWIQLAISVTVLGAIAFMHGSIVDFAYARVGTGVLSLVTYFVVTAGIVQASPLRLLRLFLRPAVAIAAMAVVVTLAGRVSHSDFVALPLEAACGGVVYGVTLLALWQFAGRPDGAESELVERLPPLRRLLARLGGARPRPLATRSQAED